MAVLQLQGLLGKRGLTLQVQSEALPCIGRAFNGCCRCNKLSPLAHPLPQVSSFVHCYTDVLWGDHVGHLLFVSLCPLSTFLPVLCLQG